MTYRQRSILLSVFMVLAVSFALPVLAESPSDERVAAASCQRCGDGYCARSCENERTCPADCAPQTFVAARCGKCGDGQCVPQCGETAQNCPKDCGGTPEEAAAVQCAPDDEPKLAEPQPAAPPSDAKKD